MKNNILITGGAGFIGSHLVRYFVENYSNYNIFNYDSLTYSSNLDFLKVIENKPNYNFIKGDICDFDSLKSVFQKYEINKIIHLAAESHVDNSIQNPTIFAKTNVMGTLNLLNIAKLQWGNNFLNKLFYHISTDEVFGSTTLNNPFNENSNYKPNSPYSASKASSDHFVRSFSKTFGLPAIISNSSNNYGPNQHPEKLIPLFINNIKNNKPLGIYGDGLNIRNWLFVEDHIKAIDLIFHSGKIGETYCIGGSDCISNLDLTNYLIRTADKMLNRKTGSSNKLIKFIKDRPGHDLCYAVDSTKVKKELRWKPNITFYDGIIKTVKWYLN